MLNAETHNLIGHEKNRQLLSKLNRDKNAGGTYLFSGPESIGKKMAAVEFAKLINCIEENEPCNACRSCKNIEKGIHPDVKLITRAKDKTVITIEQARGEIAEEANFRPIEGAYRIFIIDDAHHLNEQAQNALLKTLEEPGESIIIILVTSRPSDLLPTVVSRCREIRFFPLPAGDVEKILKKIPEMTDDKITLLSSISSGSPGKAVNLAKNDEFWKRRKSLFDILLRMPDGKLEDILSFADSYRITRSDVTGLEETFEIISTWFRDLLLIHHNVEEGYLINGDYNDEMSEIAFCYTPEGIISIQDLILEIRKLIFENNLNIKMGLQRLLIKIRQAGSVS